jgi:hypothetical protein
VLENIYNKNKIRRELFDALDKGEPVFLKLSSKYVFKDGVATQELHDKNNYNHSILVIPHDNNIEIFDPNAEPLSLLQETYHGQWDLLLEYSNKKNKPILENTIIDQTQGDAGNGVCMQHAFMRYLYSDMSLEEYKQHLDNISDQLKITSPDGNEMTKLNAVVENTAGFIFERMSNVVERGYAVGQKTEEQHLFLESLQGFKKENQKRSLDDANTNQLLEMIKPLMAVETQDRVKRVNIQQERNENIERQRLQDEETARRLLERQEINRAKSAMSNEEYDDFIKLTHEEKLTHVRTPPTSRKTTPASTPKAPKKESEPWYKDLSPELQSKFSTTTE